VGPTAGWTCAENLTTTRVRSPYCPAHSRSPYRLSYPGPFSEGGTVLFLDERTAPDFRAQGCIRVYKQIVSVVLTLVIMLLCCVSLTG
jgi:hypothetical protein